MAERLWCDVLESKRSLLAFGWSIVNLLALVSFVTAFCFVLSAKGLSSSGYSDDDAPVTVAVTSRAMAFAALWTASSAGVMSIFGTVVLGWQDCWTGRYYWCCRGSVVRTTPLAMGAFIGALVMFANLTLLCSVLFWEFEIRDYPKSGQQEGEQQQQQQTTSDSATVQRSSVAFSITCMFLTFLYASFALLVYSYSNALLDENFRDARDEALRPSDPDIAPGYIGSDRFGVPGTKVPSGASVNKFMAAPSNDSDSSLDGFS